MSLGVPAADSRNTAGNVASLFSMLGKSQQGAAGVNGRVSSDQNYKGLDWASTLRQSTTQLHEQRSRKPVSAAEKAENAVRTADRNADRKADRGATSQKDRTTDRADDRSVTDNGRQTREVNRDDASADASTQRDEIDVRDDLDATVNDDGSSTLTQDDAIVEDELSQDVESANAGDQDAADGDDAESTEDVLTLALAGAQAVVAGVSPQQQATTTDAQAQAGQSQGDVQNQKQQQAAGHASQLLQPSTATAGSAQQLLAGQAQVEGKSDGQAALPAQAANAATAQAQQNPALAGASPEQQAGSQQQNPQGQSQGQSGQSGQQQAAAQLQAAIPAAGGTPQAAALEIQTSTTGSNAQPGATAGSATAQAGPGSPAAITLPAGADALLNTQAQDDADPNVARIAQGLRSAVNLKGGAVTIRLNPHELGHVRIEMEIKNGNVSAQLQTEQASVRDLLNHQLGKLRETLQARGLHVERLEVNAPSPAEDSSAGRNAQESPDQGRSRGQFFQQRGGSDGQNGSASHNAQNISERKSFGDMLVDMVG